MGVGLLEEEQLLLPRSIGFGDELERFVGEELHGLHRTCELAALELGILLLVHLQPRVGEDLLDPIAAQSFLRRSLDEPVDEVSAFRREPTAFGHLGVLGLDLVSEHLFSIASERPLAGDELEGQDAQTVVVGSVGVVLHQQDLGGHVAWRATGLEIVLLLPSAGQSQVGDLAIAPLVHHHVFGLQVSVKDLLAVEVLEPLQNAPHQELCIHALVLTDSSPNSCFLLR